MKVEAQPKEIKNWLHFIQSSSVTLMGTEAGVITACGSGCLLDSDNRRFLVTTKHFLNSNSDWAILDSRDINRGGSDTWELANINMCEEWDIAWSEIPIEFIPTFEDWRADGECKVKKKINVFSVKQIIKPNKNEIYGFSGRIKHELITDFKVMACQHHTYPGLKFVNEVDGYYHFRLPVDHPGHIYFKGCSGAPIIDMHKNVVGLVCKGIIEKNIIVCIGLERFIDIIFS